MHVLKPPAPLQWEGPSLFLAGSIEMGAAECWQARVERELSGCSGVVLNPRRDEWDASWEQSLASPNFVAQVEWELEAQERATRILMYFDPATRAPITLLELGLFSNSGKLLVVCPDGYWRKGNVDVVCRRYSIRQAATLEVALSLLKEAF